MSDYYQDSVRVYDLASDVKRLIVRNLPSDTPAANQAVRDDLHAAMSMTEEMLGLLRDMLAPAESTG